MLRTRSFLNRFVLNKPNRNFNLYTCFKGYSMENKPVLYGDELSPPVRFTMITAAMLKVDVDFKKIELFKGENRTESFAKINPLQKVPVLQDDGETICDSHAIAVYLCQKYGGQILYPEDAKTRAKINEILFYNSGTLFPIDSALYMEYFADTAELDKKEIDKWFSSLNFLEKRLSKQPWLSGDEMRLSDICCATTISSLEHLVPALNKYEKLTKWMEKMEKLEEFELNKKGLKQLKIYIDGKNSNKN